MDILLPKWMLMMPALITRDFYVSDALGCLKWAELFGKSLRSNLAENMGQQVPAESYLLR